MLKYNAHRYDDFLHLKISPLLWFAILYGVRHFFFVAAAKLMPSDVGSTPWMGMQAHIFLMMSDLPALLILVTTGHRIPGATKVMRRVWLNGRWILACSYLLGLSVFLYLQWDVIGNPGDTDFISALFVILPDIAIMGFLLRSELIQDIFKEFPEITEKVSAKQI